ncbi:MAG: HU family DNA-binding protein [Spirochaetia bacterium]|nr:HU family DNA-binding protein [Spirochaetia bacterium]
MNKSDLIKKVSKKLKIKQKDSSTLYEALFHEITDILARGDSVQISGFGSFEVQKLEKRKGFNPLIEKWMMLPPKQKPHFTPSENLKKRINS